MIERIAALARRRDEDLEVGLGRGLAGEIVEPRRTQRTVRRLAGLAFGIGNVPISRAVAGHDHDYYAPERKGNVDVGSPGKRPGKTSYLAAIAFASPQSEIASLFDRRPTDANHPETDCAGCCRRGARRADGLRREDGNSCQSRRSTGPPRSMNGSRATSRPIRPSRSTRAVTNMTACCRTGARPASRPRSSACTHWKTRVEAIDPAPLTEAQKFERDYFLANLDRLAVLPRGSRLAAQEPDLLQPRSGRLSRPALCRRRDADEGARRSGLRTFPPHSNRPRRISRVRCRAPISTSASTRSGRWPTS